MKAAQACRQNEERNPLVFIQIRYWRPRIQEAAIIITTRMLDLTSKTMAATSSIARITMVMMNNEEENAARARKNLEAVASTSPTRWKQ